MAGLGWGRLGAGVHAAAGSSPARRHGGAGLQRTPRLQRGAVCGWRSAVSTGLFPLLWQFAVHQLM